MTRTIFASIALLLVSAAPQDQTPNARPRASDLSPRLLDVASCGRDPPGQCRAAKRPCIRRSLPPVKYVRLRERQLKRLHPSRILVEQVAQIGSKRLGIRDRQEHG